MTFVIDVSQHMGTKDPGQQHTYLEQSQLFACMQIMELMLRGLATAKVCIFTYGAGEESGKDDEDSVGGDEPASITRPSKARGMRVLWHTARPTLETLDAVQALRPAPAVAEKSERT